MEKSIAQSDQMTESPTSPISLSPSSPSDTFDPEIGAFRRVPFNNAKQRYTKRYYYRGNKAKLVTCSNCSGRGHVFKDCKKPIQSFGVLAWTCLPPLTEGDPPRLCVCLIQRRHTISYEAFIRGKYDLDELELHKDRMTMDEKKSIREVEWDVLYDNIMNNKNSADGKQSASNVYVQRERSRARALYETVDIQHTFEEKEREIMEPTWEFPKGRKFVKESEEGCALREFQEETGIPMADLTTISDPTTGKQIWFEEQFNGINKRQYHNRYLLAYIRPDSTGPFVDKQNVSQTSEVQDARYFTFEEADAILHTFHPEKRECLRQSYEAIRRTIRLI